MSQKHIFPTVILAAAAAFAQTPFDAMQRSKGEFWDYLESRARTVTTRAFAETQSAETWEKARAKRLEELRDMLGLLPWPERTPLHVVSTGVLDEGDYTVGRIAFESMPKVYVTGDLYIPKRRNGKVPAIVYVCGHANSPQGAKTQYQRHGISLAKNGYIAFILDPIQIAETFGLHHGVYSQEMFDWYSRGYSPGGVETWNAIRAVDYLVTRPDVDAARIGITGRSGGAATSWYAGALDPRIKVVAPVMGMGTYAEAVRNKAVSLHCDCMFPVNVFGQDWIDQAALVAPRPLLLAHGSKDVLFPGYPEVVKQLEALYTSYGRPGDFRSIVVDTGHADSDYLREEAIRWFDRYLMRTPDRKLDMSYTNEAPEKLAVYGGAPPADAQDFRVQQFFVPRAKLAEYTSRGAWEKRRGELLAQLREKVFPQMPKDAPAVTVEPLPRAADAPEGYEDLRITAPGRAPVRALVRRPKKANGAAPALLLVAAEGDSPRSLNAMLAGVNTRDTAVRMILFPAGIGEVGWDREFYKAATRHAMLLGETVDSIRLAGVLMGVAALRKDAAVDGRRILVAGRGVAGALALYAAVLDEGIQQVMMLDAPESHLAGPVFLDVLRYTDLPEAAALLAPRHLTFYSRMPAAYAYTQRVYKLMGQAANLSVAMQFEGVVEGRYDHNFGSGM